MPRRTAVLVLGAGLVAVALLTLGPLPLGGLSGFHRLLRLGATTIGAPVPSRAMAEAAANVLLFVPVGAGLALFRRRPRFWVAVLLLASISVGIEVVQSALPARTPSLRDIATNTTGGALGLLVVLLGRRVARARRVGQPPAA